MSTPSPFLESVRNTIRLKHYSIRMEEAYVQWAKRFVLFHGKRHPEEMAAREVEAFLTHFAVDGGLLRVRKIRLVVLCFAPNCSETHAKTPEYSGA